MANNENYIDKIAVKTYWAENNGYGESNGADCDFVCDTLEQGIQILQALEKTYTKRITEELKERELTFNEDNLDVEKNYGENQHINPNIDLTYVDDEECLTLVYGAELRVTKYVDPKLNNVETINKMVEEYYL